MATCYLSWSCTQATAHDDPKTLLGKLLQVENSRSWFTVASTEFVRPADTTAYAANDVVGTNPATNRTFLNAARIAGGSGYITNVRLTKSSATVTNAFFRLWLYAVAPTAIADNAQMTLLWANRANRFGYIDLACTTEGTGSDSAMALVTNINLKFDCAEGDRNIYGVLEAKQAYTPASGETFFIELTVDQP